jgi:ApeA N-terminal domain 1
MQVARNVARYAQRVDEKHAVRGRWWLAAESFKEGVPGTLTISDDGFQLDLEGTLLTDPALKAKVLDHRAPVPIDRIHGETADRKAVTLETCQLARSGTHMVRDRETSYSESYWPTAVCLGAWFSADEPFAFDQVFVRLSSLHPWTAVSGFDPQWQVIPGDESETVTQRYTPPPERRAQLSDETIIKLKFPLVERTQGLYTFEKTFTQATHFAFEFAEPRSLREVQAYVFTLRNLITLGVGEAVRITELIGYRKPLPGEEPPLGREAEILYEHLENPHAREAANHHFMVFTLSDIEEQFEDHIVRWFDRAADLGRVLDLYFSTLHAPFTHLETRFMNFAQAIEGYHRRRLNRFAYPEETFEAYRLKILDKLTGDPRRLAKKALKYANEISLESRIKDVLKLLGDPATSIVTAGKDSPDQFAKRAAEIRNVYAHNLEGEEPDYLELVVFEDQLKTLVEALLLHEIGFEPRAIDEMLRRSRRYELIKAMRVRREAS